MQTRQNGLLLVELNLSPWDERQAALLTLLPAEEQARIQRYRQDQDRSRGLVAALLPRLLIARESGQPLAAIRFVRGPHGKPYDPDDSSLHFNLSHSGAYVALAVGSEAVGVDVEQIRPPRDSLCDPAYDSAYPAHEPVRDIEAIAQRFFATDEQQRLARFAESERQARFIELWSRKESVLKATGDGLAGALSSFSVIPETDAGVEVSADAEAVVGAKASTESSAEVGAMMSTGANMDIEMLIKFRGESWHLRSYQGIPGCALALCARAPGLPAPIRVSSSVEALIERTTDAITALARVADDQRAS